MHSRSLNLRQLLRTMGQLEKQGTEKRETLKQEQKTVQECCMSRDNFMDLGLLV